MNHDLHNALLDFQLHGDQLERALGRGGGNPIDLERALQLIPPTKAALEHLEAVTCSLVTTSRAHAQTPTADTWPAST